MDGWSIYTYSTQFICLVFDHLLQTRDTLGLVIPDSRAKHQDRRVSFSIFTQKFKAAGDAYRPIIEMPAFGQSNNHAGIQVCDLICSGLLFPIAAYTYCTGYVQNLHVDPGYQTLRARYGLRLRNLQHRFQRPDGRWSGGITVSDQLGQQNGGLLFRPN